MEKRTYIQPKMEMAVMPNKGLMTPNSPTDGTYDAGAPKRHDTGPSGVWL